jgi:hypothetical protein
MTAALKTMVAWKEGPFFGGHPTFTGSPDVAVHRHLKPYACTAGVKHELWLSG